MVMIFDIDVRKACFSDVTPPHDIAISRLSPAHAFAVAGNVMISIWVLLLTGWYLTLADISFITLIVLHQSSLDDSMTRGVKE